MTRVMGQSNHDQSDGETNAITVAATDLLLGASKQPALLFKNMCASKYTVLTEASPLVFN